MTANSLNILGEAFGILTGAGFLFLFGLTLGLPYVTGLQAARSGHRQRTHGEAQHTGYEEAQRGRASDEGPEVVRPDGFIDSFAEVIEEGGGGLPPVVALTFVGVLTWYIVYLVIFWAPRGYPYVI
jgi:hypothetical protein